MADIYFEELKDGIQENGYIHIHTFGDNGELTIGLHGYQNDEMELSIEEWRRVRDKIDKVIEDYESSKGAERRSEVTNN
jgi:hypothetical protein